MTPMHISLMLPRCCLRHQTQVLPVLNLRHWPTMFLHPIHGSRNNRILPAVPQATPLPLFCSQHDFRRLLRVPGLPVFALPVTILFIASINPKPYMVVSSFFAIVPITLYYTPVFPILSVRLTCRNLCMSPPASIAVVALGFRVLWPMLRAHVST